jgi:hypothetical protein
LSEILLRTTSRRRGLASAREARSAAAFGYPPCLFFQPAPLRLNQSVAKGPALLFSKLIEEDGMRKSNIVGHDRLSPFRRGLQRRWLFLLGLTAQFPSQEREFLRHALFRLKACGTPVRSGTLTVQAVRHPLMKA